MPQLDLTSWFTQYFWFSVMFIILFFTTVTVYMPKIYAGLRVRQLLLSTTTSDTTEPYKIEEDKLQKDMESRIAAAYSEGKVAFQSAVVETAQWSDEMVKATNATDFEEANGEYVENLVQTVSEADLLLEAIHKDYDAATLETIKSEYSLEYDAYGYVCEPDEEEFYEEEYDDEVSEYDEEEEDYEEDSENEISEESK